MSQKSVFICDQDRKIIGPKMHLSVMMGSCSGIALPPESDHNSSKAWRVESTQGFHHFCNAECLAKFFNNKIKSLKKKS